MENLDPLRQKPDLDNSDFWKKVCAYLALFLIGAIIFIVMQCQAGKDTDLSKNAEISKLREKDKLNQEVQTRQDSIIASERHAREIAHRTASKSDSLYRAERTMRQGHLKQLIALRAASGIQVDTITVEIEAQYREGAKADSIQIQKLEAKILSDSTSFETEIKSWATKFDSEAKISEGWRLQAIKSTSDAQKYKRQRNTATLIAVLEALLIVLIAVL